MKTIDEMIAVMTAYKEGKKIEVYDWMKKIWMDAEHPCWDWGGEDYRVKAEPKYRPYANADECFKDVQKHGGWVHGKDSYFVLITACTDKYVWLNGGVQRTPYAQMIDDYVWADDGSPCGVLEE